MGTLSISKAKLKDRDNREIHNKEEIMKITMEIKRHQKTFISITVSIQVENKRLKTTLETNGQDFGRKVMRDNDSQAVNKAMEIPKNKSKIIIETKAATTNKGLKVKTNQINNRIKISTTQGRRMIGRLIPVDKTNNKARKVIRSVIIENTSINTINLPSEEILTIGCTHSLIRSPKTMMRNLTLINLKKVDLEINLRRKHTKNMNLKKNQCFMNKIEGMFRIRKHRDQSGQCSSTYLIHSR